jgi:hypothetical protein
LVEALDGARYVYVDWDANVLHVWFGASTVIMYGYDGECLDSYGIRETDSYRDVHDAIVRKVEYDPGV